MIQIYAIVYGIYRAICLTTYVQPVLLLKLYFKDYCSVVYFG